MSLKEQFIDDTEVLLNPDELANIIKLKLAEGYEISINAVTEEIFSDSYKQGSSRMTVGAVYKRYVTIYAKEADFIKGLPRNGDWIYYNDKRMSVIKCISDIGMVCLELGANES